MKAFLPIMLFFLLMDCGSSKVEQNVTLHDRETTSSKKIMKSFEKSADVDERAKEIHEIRTEASQPKTMTGETAQIKLPSGDTSRERIEEIMNYLTSDELQGRDSGSEGIEKAANYIAAIFEANNIAPYFNNYRDTLSNFDKTAFNVVGYLEGSDNKLKNEFIIIGAHYDHIGILEPKDGDNIANGANDNASGTTTVLELARHFANSRSNRRSIIFALFSAEEKGLLGSKHLAQKLKEQEIDLYTMLNFEMVGVPLVDKNYFMYVTGYEESNLAGVGNMYVGSNLIGFLPQAKEYNLFKRSDNYPFHEVFNVPSQTFCTFDFTNFDHYHQVGDEVGLMDFDHMAEVVKKSIPLIQSISNSMTKMIKYK
ncbi:M28 family metallopeptidase [Maribacter algicola]|uniref:M28 family metallopeptidase n=1 Tax=Meishania litoralis TaxID=3434685 RepID=A0ACC7LLY1_9FLAO